MYLKMHAIYSISYVVLNKLIFSVVKKYNSFFLCQRLMLNSAKHYSSPPSPFFLYSKFCPGSFNHLMDLGFLQ